LLEAEDEHCNRASVELLAELGQEEQEPEFDDEERDDAAIAEHQARYLRREQDQLLYSRLASAGFQGPEYEIFRGELAAYALPVIRSWLRRGLIFAYALQQGRPLKVTEYDRTGLQDVEERIGLAHETVARALTLFHQRDMTAAGWSYDGGAAITTYFVGACVAVFPGVFRRWQRGRATWNKAVKAVDSSGSHAQDPADEVVSRQRVIADLRRMPDAVRAIAERVVWEGSSHAEIAAELNLTERSVEGRLYRYRSEYQRRRGEGRDE
jgi:DNA-directed RNA polymerase specialized sigma24 family protein